MDIILLEGEQDLTIGSAYTKLLFRDVHFAITYGATNNETNVHFQRDCRLRSFTNAGAVRPKQRLLRSRKDGAEDDTPASRLFLAE